MTSVNDLQQSSGAANLTKPMPAVADDKTAVLLIAHGSRRAQANDDLLDLAQTLRQRTTYRPIEPSYLELAEPTVLEAGRRCVEQGAQRVLMFPYFLSAGRHVAEDLERLRQELSERNPAVDFQLCPPLGRHPLLIEIVQQRLAERLDSSVSPERLPPGEPSPE